MSSQNLPKINFLLQRHKLGAILPQSWLEKQGYNRQLIQKYVHSKWLERFAHGAYLRTGDHASYEGVVYSLQNLLTLPVHLGGKTALQYFGFSHYVNLSDNAPIFLYSHAKKNVKLQLPKWFNDYVWQPPFEIKNKNLILQKNSEGLTEQPSSTKNFTLIFSTPERAILELLYLVPAQQTIEEAYYIMEGLTILLPSLMQSLLKGCLSYKVKRLFLLLAEECGHAWFKKIDLKKIDLGKGKQKIGTGGKFYSKYNLSIPPLPKENTSSDEMP